jgi:hypothetical protein
VVIARNLQLKLALNREIQAILTILTIKTNITMQTKLTIHRRIPLKIFKVSTIGLVMGLVLMSAMGNYDFASAAPVVDPGSVMVTDVTPFSFSVIWSSNEPATASLNIFSDEDGTTPAMGISLEPHPTASGDMTIKTKAEDNGVMKVKVTGLKPDTTYYFQTITTSKAAPSEISFSPQSAPMLSATTEVQVIRTSLPGPDKMIFMNDLIVLNCFLPDGATPAEGTLLVAVTDESNHPISGFVGDGVPPPQAYVDLNNMFSSRTYQTLPLYGGESLTLTQFMGIHGIESRNYIVPTNHQLARMKPPLIVDLCYGDFKPDGDVDGEDLNTFMEDFVDINCDTGESCQSDFNSDGKVDGADLELFLAHFARTDCPEVD